VTSGLLRFRREHRDVFDEGAYEPLVFDGQRRDHAFGFARSRAGRTVLVVVPRLIAGLTADGDVPPLGERVWGDAMLRVPAGGAKCYRHVLTGDCAPVENGHVRLARVFAHAPVAFLDAQ
jgi:(1->4)-alpha-D-glucan 1-alpha-D-glucosylmutase